MLQSKPPKPSSDRSSSRSGLMNLPFFSLFLLLLTYALLGWYVAEPKNTWIDWLVVSGIIILIALTLISPVTQIRRFFGVWLQSNATAFLSIVIFAFAAVMILTRLDLFAQWLILLAPGLLVRLDLQVAGYRDWPTFSIITTVCLAGYSGGLVARQLLTL